MDKKITTFDEYQEGILKNVPENGTNDLYMLLGLAAKVGSLSGKIARAVRLQQASVCDNDICYKFDVPPADTRRLIKEMKDSLADVLMYTAGLSRLLLDCPLSEIAQESIERSTSKKLPSAI